MVTDESAARSVHLQAQGCAALGSEFSAALLENAAQDLDARGPTCDLFTPWAMATTRDLITAAAPLRLLGALHDLALSGDDPALTSAYPGAGRAGDPAAAWRAARAAISARPAPLVAFMAHEPQTNEVRRSACLLPGFLAIAAATGLPLRCFELGASAGLNQLWDRYRYRLGDVGAWGDAAAPVSIETDWRCAAPALEATVKVVERAACDSKPVDLADAGARRRLKAYVWADQIDRLDRLDAAIAIARANAVEVDRDDAVAWAPRRVQPRTGAATVLFHSVFWQYMPTASQRALTEEIERLGAAASSGAPFAWLRMEPPASTLAWMELRLTIWPTGDERLVAKSHPHGAWVEWLAIP